MRKYENIIPNWKLKIEEVSNNVYLVTGKAIYGSEVSYKDSNFDFAIQQCENYAFDIEKQINKEWSKFLYDYLKIKLDKYSIITDRYDRYAFGSWFIEFEDYRVIFDGKDYRMIIQTKDNNSWTELLSENIKAFSFSDVLTYCDIIERKVKGIQEKNVTSTKQPFIIQLLNKLKRK